MRILDKEKYYDISNLNENQLLFFIEEIKKDNFNHEILEMINNVRFPINRKYLKARIIYWDQTKWNLAFNNYIDASKLF